MSPTIISITNQKGGVGKTTTACALLSSLHNRGAKVLGVDLDPQEMCIRDSNGVGAGKSHLGHQTVIDPLGGVRLLP